MSRFSPFSPPVHDEPEVVSTFPAEPPEVIARRNREDAERATRQAAFLAQYGGTETITLEPEQMAVVAQLCYDNSDSMTDYFDRHASIGPELVLMVVKKGRQDERKARAALALYPELAALTFEWRTENYSMGHGNYLIQKGGVDIPLEANCGRTRYPSSTPVTRGHWEIQFEVCWQQQGKVMHVFKSWPGVGAPKPRANLPATNAGGIRLQPNPAKNGLQLYFDNKPSEEIRAELKAAGWRWSRFAGCWYHRDTPQNLDFAQRFIARNTAPAAAPEPPAQYEHQHDSNEPMPARVDVAPDPEPAPVELTVAPGPIRSTDVRVVPATAPAWRLRLFRP